MTSVPLIVLLVVFVSLLITFVVPGGVFVGPVIILAGLIWAAVRLIGGRRDSTAEGPR
jgi:hypothetical protein